METEYIMIVDLILKDEEKGKRIAGGANPHYSTTDLSWLNVIGEEILVQGPYENLFFKVEKVEIFPGFTGALNIGLTLEDKAEFESISEGDKVYIKTK